MTCFAGGIPTIDFDEGSSIPLALVVQLANGTGRSDLPDRLGDAVIFDQVLDGQTLHANHLVFVDDACTEFVLVISTTVIDTSMHTRYFAPCLLSVLGALFLFCVSPLGFCQALLILGTVARIAHSFTSGEDHHRLETQVKANLRVDDRKRFDVFFNQDRDKIAVRTVLAHGNRAGLAIRWKVSMPDNI